MFRRPPDRCRSAGGPRHALAAFLRHLASWLDPPQPDAPRDRVEVSRDEFRRIQAEAMGMVKTWIDLSRAHSPDDGLMWIPRMVLSSITYVVGLELDARDHDFATIESDPRTVLR